VVVNEGRYRRRIPVPVSTPGPYPPSLPLQEPATIGDWVWSIVSNLWEWVSDQQAPLVALAAIATAVIAILALRSTAKDSRERPRASRQADGVATRDGQVEVVEVELTVKKLARYRSIHAHFGKMLSSGTASRVVYVCTPEVGRVVSREADKFVLRDQRDRLLTLALLDSQGKWTDLH
jgi:hypothetical protein